MQLPRVHLLVRDWVLLFLSGGDVLSEEIRNTSLSSMLSHCAGPQRWRVLGGDGECFHADLLHGGSNLLIFDVFHYTSVGQPETPAQRRRRQLPGTLCSGGGGGSRQPPPQCLAPVQGERSPDPRVLPARGAHTACHPSLSAVSSCLFTAG